MKLSIFYYYCSTFFTIMEKNYPAYVLGLNNRVRITILLVLDRFIVILSIVVKITTIFHLPIRPNSCYNRNAIIRNILHLRTPRLISYAYRARKWHHEDVSEFYRRDVCKISLMIAPLAVPFLRISP